MIRPLVLLTVYPSASSPVEGLFNAEHIRALAAAGVDPTVVVCKPWLPDPLARGWPRYRSLAGLPKMERRDGVPIAYARYLHLPGYRYPAWTVASCARSVLASIRRSAPIGRFNLVHAHSAFPTGLAAPAVARALGLRYIVTLHIQDEPALYTAPEGKRLYEEMFRRTAAVAVVGSPLERFARRWIPVGSAASVRVIPNGVDLGEIASAVGTGKREGGWGHIVSVSSLWPVKGIDLNLRALAQLDREGVRGWRYTVVGDGPERQRLEALARELRIADRASFTGWLCHKDALRAIARADIFSLPSWSEAFGIAYLEAMACGKPVIGCRGQGAEDLVKDGADGLLVEPKDVTSLASALSYLVRNPEQARELGRLGCARAQGLTWSRNAEEYIRIYREMTGRREGVEE